MSNVLKRRVILSSNFETTLPSQDSKELLIGAIDVPKLVRGMLQLYLRITSSLPGIGPRVFIFTILLYAVDGLMYLVTALTGLVSCVAADAIIVDWKAFDRLILWPWICNVYFIVC